MRKLPDREKKQRSNSQPKQQQTRASRSPGWDAACDLVEWLFLMLEKKGITNEQLSEATGISILTIQSWQKTERIPSLENMINCAGYLGYDILPMREPFRLKEDLLYWPIKEFRQELLDALIVSKALAEARQTERQLATETSEEAQAALLVLRAKTDAEKVRDYIDRHSSEEARNKILEKVKARNKALGEDDGEEAQDINDSVGHETIDEQRPQNEADDQRNEIVERARVDPSLRIRFRWNG